MGKDNIPKCSILSHPQLEKGNFCLALVLQIYHNAVQIAVFVVATNFGMVLPILRRISAVLKKNPKNKQHDVGFSHNKYNLINQILISPKETITYLQGGWGFFLLVLVKCRNSSGFRDKSN